MYSSRTLALAGAVFGFSLVAPPTPEMQPVRSVTPSWAPGRRTTGSR
jgi:hypothetical protein